MTVGSLYGVAMLLIGVGLVIAGLIIARRRMLTGWARWITLATGGYVFVILFPAVFRAECGRKAGDRWLDVRLGGRGMGRCPGRARGQGGGAR
jgi:cell division protein FtsW (lipid II flippase)